MRKNKLILLQLVIAFVLICTSVYAAVTTTIDVSPSKTLVERGEVVTVTLSLKDVDSNMKVESVEGYINYDESVIKAIDVDSIHKDQGNTVTIGNETLKVEDLTNADINNMPSTESYVAFNGSPASGNKTRIVIDFKQGLTEDTELLKIDFEVKEDATTGSIENAISYSMFVITAGTEESVEITENIDLTVKAVSTNDNNTNSENENTNTENENTNTDNNTNTDDENTNTENENTNVSNENTNTDNDNTNVNNENTNAADNTNSNTNKNTNNNNTNNNNTNNNNTNKNTNNSGNTSDNTTSGSKLPATGAKLLVIPAIILSVVAYISYDKYMKYKGI